MSEAAGGTMRWLYNSEESALCSTMHEERERREERGERIERGRERGHKLKQAGDIW